MVISEMISELKFIMDMHGDMPVYIAASFDAHDFNCNEVCKIETNHFAKWNDDKKELESLHSVTLLYGEKG